MKSDIEIKDDIYNYIKKCALDKEVSGKLCKRGILPAGSDKEDIVLNVLANENGDTQQAVVNVNVYVPDDFIDNQYEENTLRLRELCKIFKDKLNRGYGKDFHIYLMSQRVLAVNGANVHVINNKLEYKHLNE